MTPPVKIALFAALGLFALGLLQMMRPSAASGPDTLEHVNDATFASVLKESKTPVLVDFYADWCGPCRTIKPIVENLATANTNRLTVLKLNVDLAPKTASANRISGIPCLILYKHGQEIDRQVGAQSQADYQKWLDPHL